MSQENGREADGRELIARMNAIRNVSEFHVAELHEEAQRLVDWREHVRAQPLISLGLATVAGFVVAHRGASRVQPTQQPRSSAEPQVKATATAGMAVGLTALLGSVATSAIRAYASKIVNNLIEGNHNEHRDVAEDAFKR